MSNKKPALIPNQKCLACGGSHFLEPFSQSKITPVSTEPAMMVFVLCASCGFVHEYAEAQLTQWAKRHRP